jgi:hypothetical protein
MFPVGLGCKSMNPHALAPAPTQFVTAGDVRFAYRRFGKKEERASIFHHGPTGQGSSNS